MIIMSVYFVLLLLIWSCVTSWIKLRVFRVVFRAFWWQRPLLSNARLGNFNEGHFSPLNYSCSLPIRLIIHKFLNYLWLNCPQFDCILFKYALF